MKTIEEKAREYSEDFVNRTPYDVFGGKAYICASEINVSGEVENAFIAGARSEHEELTRWNSPECPPEHSNTVLVKTPHGDTFYYSLGNYYQGQWHISAIHNEIIGWREIHE